MYSRPETRHTPPALNRANPLPDDAAAISGKRLYSFVALPSWQELKVFLDFAGPIAFALLGKVFGSSQLQYGFFFVLLLGFFTARYGQTRRVWKSCWSCYAMALDTRSCAPLTQHVPVFSLSNDRCSATL